MGIRQKYNIAVVINERYLRHMFVMLSSLFDNNIGSAFRVYIFVSSHAAECFGSINTFFCRTKQQYTIIIIEDSLLGNVPILDENMSSEAYYKLLIPLKMPQEVDRVLYLDADIIVQGSIVGLWNSDLEGKAFGAVTDYFMNQDIEYKSRLMRCEDSYVNTGVLLIDLSILRKIYQFDIIMQYIRENGKQFRFHDQEVINALFYQEMKILDEKYNYICMYRNLWDPIVYKMKDERSDICIYHYALSGNKPWNPHYRGKYGNLYWKYARKVGLKKEYYHFIVRRVICFPIRMWELYCFHYKVHLKPWVRIKMKKRKRG